MSEPATIAGRRYVRLFWWTLGIALAGWGAALVVVDPRREFFGSPFPAVTPNTRADKLQRLAAYAARDPVATIVLGSSRAFSIDPRDLSARGFGRAFSLTVHGGGVRDLLALSRTVRAMGIRPRTVVLGVDETWLSRAFDDAYELKHDRMLQARLAPDGRPPSVLAHALSVGERMLTPAYAMDAVRSVRAWAAHVPPRTVTDSSGYTWEPHRDAEIARDSAESLVAIGRSVAFLVPPLVDYAGVDTSRADALGTLLRELEDDGVRIVAYLTPYHPLALARIADGPRTRDGLRRARADMMGLFGRAGIRLHDLQDPASFGASPHQWYDAFHMQAPNGARLLDELVRRGL